MNETRYIALLRGINVGGNNIIRMSDLKASFEELGFSDVVTYIQSGNVLFNTGEKDKQLLIERIEQHLSERFAYQSKIVLLSKEQLQHVVDSIPHGLRRSSRRVPLQRIVPERAPDCR
jgi:uncharacterized protein (DUF1697 family)